ncbi:hypothetical protein BDR26DRAFT_877131 [Obelidium mucronatum]|nr:hypothetical protein BDR26DRAFT_877131 [Obelidium mucronatum]
MSFRSEIEAMVQNQVVEVVDGAESELDTVASETDYSGMPELLELSESILERSHYGIRAGAREFLKARRFLATGYVQAEPPARFGISQWVWDSEIKPLNTQDCYRRVVPRVDNGTDVESSFSTVHQDGATQSPVVSRGLYHPFLRHAVQSPGVIRIGQYVDDVVVFVEDQVTGDVQSIVLDGDNVGAVVQSLVNWKPKFDAGEN